MEKEGAKKKITVANSTKVLGSEESKLVVDLEILKSSKKKSYKDRKSIPFVIPSLAKKYDNAPAELIEAFKDVDLANLTEITLGGNTYDSESCKWIKENVLLKAPNLHKVNFNNMFVTRLREDLPISVKFLFEGLKMENITFIDLSDNAIGPEIKVIEK